jgi:predicted nucleic acid-binding Zn ribbon protein
MIMEDLIEKFYGKPESEGSSDAPPSEPVDRVTQVEQRIGLVETQLLQMARAQQAILARLDTMIDQQAAQPEPQHEWKRVPPPLKREPQPEPGELIADEGTPLAWDLNNKTLQAMDEGSEDALVARKPWWDDPSQQERPEGQRGSTHGPTRTCVTCGREFPMKMDKMAGATHDGPGSLRCPRCHEENRKRRNSMLIMFFVGLVVLFLIALVKD